MIYSEEQPKKKQNETRIPSGLNTSYYVETRKQIDKRRSTSAQCDATRRIVSLSICYFHRFKRLV